MPRPPRLARITAALAVVLLAGTAACRDDRGDEPPAATSTTAVASTDDPAGFVPEPIAWGPCDDRGSRTTTECATVAVPLDHARPDGERRTVQVTRVPATGERIGPLFVNPGGPGGEAAGYARQLSVLLPEAITERFDLVAVEPRGLPGSGPIDCGMAEATLYRPDPTIDSPADRTELLDVSRRYTDGCAARVGLDTLALLGTRDVALDLDVVRAAMGDEQLSYLGASYGTSIGQVYAQLFPARVRAMVLDGVVELGVPGLDAAHDQAAGFEDALQRWAAACRADDACPVGDDPVGAVEDVLAAAERPGGLPAPGADRSAGPSEANLGIGLTLYSPSLWSSLEAALDDALDGDGTALVDLADEYLGVGGFDVYFAVNCLDQAWPTGDPDAVLAAAAEAGRSAPHFGEALVNDYVRCATWPVPPQPLEASALPGTPPILVVSTTGDPATPYEQGVRLARSLADGVLLTYDGEGHGATAGVDACIDDHVARYLVDLDPPADGTTCPD